MLVYLPIAEMPVDLFLLLGVGAVVGFVSGMFGVGGGFLLTPLLVFVGISPAVAVGSVSAQVVASSISGMLGYRRRGLLDGRLALMLSAFGVIGSAIGIWVFAALRRFGQLDLVVALCYVAFLGSVGGFMVVESVVALRARRRGDRPAVAGRRPGPVRRLPFPILFPKSRLVISILPIAGLGIGIGFLGTLLGIGGGFLIVPALIYLLRVPGSLVVGTSLVQMVVTMSFATFLQAAENGTVDLVLAFTLMIGGVIGAQFGVAVGRRLRGEELRVLLGLLILAVGLRFAVDLVVPPSEPYSLTRAEGGVR
jgi:uncharacterized membrane protein YfcA